MHFRNIILQIYLITSFLFLTNAALEESTELVNLDEQEGKADGRSPASGNANNNNNTHRRISASPPEIRTNNITEPPNLDSLKTPATQTFDEANSLNATTSEEQLEEEFNSLRDNELEQEDNIFNDTDKVDYLDSENKENPQTDSHNHSPNLDPEEAKIHKEFEDKLGEFEPNDILTLELPRNEKEVKYYILATRLTMMITKLCLRKSNSPFM